MLARITTPEGEVIELAFAQEEEGDEADEDHTVEETGAHEEDESEAPNPILPATDELVWSIISFAVLLFLFMKFAFPAVKQAMDNRTDRIRETLDEAERTKAEAQSVLEDYQRQLADARNESARIIDEARQTAEQMRRDLMARAEAEVAELRQRAQEEIAAAQSRAAAELEQQLSNSAIDLAERIVDANLDRDAQMRLIEGYINEVGSRT